MRGPAPPSFPCAHASVRACSHAARESVLCTDRTGILHSDHLVHPAVQAGLLALLGRGRVCLSERYSPIRLTLPTPRLGCAWMLNCASWIVPTTAAPR